MNTAPMPHNLTEHMIHSKHINIVGFYQEIGMTVLSVLSLVRKLKRKVLKHLENQRP